MGLLNIFSRSKKRSVYPFGFPDDGDFLEHIANTYAGINVNYETALRLGVVFACVRVIAETISTLPILSYTESADGIKKVNKKDPLYTLLNYRPAPWLSGPDFFKFQVACVLLQGDGFAEVVTKRGKVDRLIPLHPKSVKVELKANGDKIFTFFNNNGDPREIPQDRMLHFKGLSADGVRGISVVDEVAKQSIGLGLAQEQYAGRAFGKRANVAGVLTHPGKMDDEMHDRIAKSWRSAYAGIQNSHKVAIVEEGMDFKPISMTNEALQFIESRQFQVIDICRIFRVPPHKVMDLTNAHYDNVEHSNTDFYTDTISPLATSMEREMDWILVGGDEVQSRYVRFNINALLRGDIKTRAEVQNIRLNNGMQNINEAREEEGWNPIGSEGDQHRIPLNTGNVKDSGEQQEGDDSQETEKPTEAQTTKDAERMRYAYLRSLEDIIARVCRREAAEIRTEKKKSKSRNRHEWDNFCAQWGNDIAKVVAETTRTTIYAWVETLIFYENLSKNAQKRGRFIENSTQISADLAQKWGKSYGDRSSLMLKSVVLEGKREMEEIAEEIERSRAREEAEKWIDEIRKEVEIHLYGVRQIVHETPPTITVKVETPQLETTTVVQEIDFDTTDDGKRRAKVTKQITKELIQ